MQNNVVEYAVTLVSKTRLIIHCPLSLSKLFGLRSRTKSFTNLIVATKAHAALVKFSPDIEDVKAVATGILRHQLLKET
jgi:MoxR-like ATPase